ncbi:MAG TPA: hypothetical protein VGD81_01650 [Opitutaceae bacterium]
METLTLGLPELEEAPVCGPGVAEHATLPIMPVAIADVRAAVLRGNRGDCYQVDVSPNEYARPDRMDDPFRKWDNILESGRSYLVGEQVPMESFIRTHRTSLRPWQKVAVAFCRSNPDQALHIENARLCWVFRSRGEFVELGLPYHDSGGEKYWVSRDGVTRILIDVD